MYSNRCKSDTSQSQGSTRNITLSKLMSWILRHGANEEALPIDSNGFIDVNVLLMHRCFISERYTLDEIKNVVATDRKRRYTLDKLPDGKLCIKANQGHSITKIQMTMRKIVDPTEMPIAVHGTYYRFWRKIKDEGLKKMGRNHIHLTEHEKFNTEISGFRSNSEILIYVDVAKAMSNGIVFYRSENDVILTEGVNGAIPNKYFSKVIDRLTKNRLQ